MLVKQMPHDTKHIILANMTVKLYSWMRGSFRTVVRQRIWGEAVVFNSSFLIYSFI